jgi:hypothetical protein
MPVFAQFCVNRAADLHIAQDIAETNVQFLVQFADGQGTVDINPHR